jgi:hypothetical protein
MIVKADTDKQPAQEVSHEQIHGVYFSKSFLQQ